ncbi:MAG: UDP-N-acetylglucosamine acyltransferase [Desulfovibrionales bacterium]|jgi:UDP-N-acetylglucosamine acyltransferase|nr:UDP-N-acetylglucosamine acyltransferase [Desulfovibrionales bacterium]
MSSIHTTAVIHPTAIIHPDAEIGANVEIGAFCTVEDKVSIGEGTVLEPYVRIKSFTSLGANNKVHSHAVLGGEPQHLGFAGEETWVRIGESNIIREHVTINRGTKLGRGETIVGDHCFLMAYVHIAHDCTLHNHVIMANNATLAGHVDIGDHAVINGMTGIHQFVRIGEYAFIGAMGGFVQDVPPFMLATGVRGKLHGPNTIGLKRHGFSPEACKALRKAYRIIFRSGLTRAEALERAESETEGIPEVKRLTDFIRHSERGIAPAATREDNGYDY